MRRERLWPVAAFTALYLAAATVGTLAIGNREFIFYIVVMLLLVGVIWLVQREIRLSTARSGTAAATRCRRPLVVPEGGRSA